MRDNASPIMDGAFIMPFGGDYRNRGVACTYLTPLLALPVYANIFSQNYFTNAANAFIIIYTNSRSLIGNFHERRYPSCVTT